MDFAEIDAGGGPETGIQLGVALPRIFLSSISTTPEFEMALTIYSSASKNVITLPARI